MTTHTHAIPSASCRTASLRAQLLGAISAHRRPARITTLLAAIVVLSIGDLVLTLGHMSTTGMFEANPIVATLASWSESGLAIANFKGLTVVVGVSLLFRLRRHRSAELAAWLVAAVLVALSIQWNLYASEVAELGPMVRAETISADAGWVVLR